MRNAYLEKLITESFETKFLVKSQRAESRMHARKTVTTTDY